MTPLLFQAKLWMVSTTRVLFAWAVWMTLVSFELVQPLQPTEVAPSLSVTSRLPLAAAPIPK